MIFLLFKSICLGSNEWQSLHQRNWNHQGSSQSDIEQIFWFGHIIERTFRRSVDSDCYQSTWTISFEKRRIRKCNDWQIGKMVDRFIDFKENVSFKQQINFFQNEIDKVRSDNVKLCGQLKFMRSHPVCFSFFLISLKDKRLIFLD